MLSEVVTCNCARNPGGHAESNPRPSEEGVSFYHVPRPLDRCPVVRAVLRRAPPRRLTRGHCQRARPPHCSWHPCSPLRCCRRRGGLPGELCRGGGGSIRGGGLRGRAGEAPVSPDRITPVACPPAASHPAFHFKQRLHGIPKEHHGLAVLIPRGLNPASDHS